MSQLGALLPQICTAVPGPRSMALAERLRGVESRNVTHLSPDFPVFWEEAAAPPATMTSEQAEVGVGLLAAAIRSVLDGVPA